MKYEGRKRLRRSGESRVIGGGDGKVGSMKVGRKKFLWLREGADDAVGIYHFQTVTNCHALIASGSKALGLAWVFKYGEFAIFAREIVRVPFLRRAVAEILK